MKLKLKNGTEIQLVNVIDKTLPKVRDTSRDDKVWQTKPDVWAIPGGKQVPTDKLVEWAMANEARVG